MNIQFIEIPLSVSGIVFLPASKSITNRVLIIRAAGNIYFEIRNCSESNDTLLLKKMLRSETNVLNAEDAGTAMRFMTALAASTFGEWIITGTERMKQRPIGLLVESLRKLGAIIEYSEKDGFPPLKITGTKLKASEIEINGNISSQFISALLMIAPTVLGGLVINIKEPVFSKPYIEMTLNLMGYFGIEYSWKNNKIYIAEQEYKQRNITIEPDWSAASYWYEITALSQQSDITLKGLKKNSNQGDCILANIFERLGVKTTSVKRGIKLSKTEIIAKSFEMDCSGYPDIVPALSVTLSLMNIPFHLTGLDSLRIKESDRILALQNELSKIGVIIIVEKNSIQWDGKLKNISEEIIFETYNDHRIAMALAPVLFKFPYIKIKNAQVVNKSYPSFWKDLENVGFTFLK